MKTKLLSIANEAPHKGCSRVGKPIIRPRSRYATKYTLHVLRKETSRAATGTWPDPNADTKEIERVAVGCSNIDVWGGVGEHYTLLTSTTARLCDRSSRNVACQNEVLDLPRASTLSQSNCCFNDLKSHHIRPNFPQNGQNPLKSKIRALVRSYMDERAPSTFPGFFSARANGKEAIANKIL